MTFDEIEATLPWGLHDAYLEGIVLDWMQARLELDVRLMMTERQDMDQRARVTVHGLVYCSIEPPELDPPSVYTPMPDVGLWIDTGSNPVSTGSDSRLPTTPDGCFLQWIFVHDWNRFIHVCGKDVSFAWLEPNPLPSRASSRAAFPGDIVRDPKAD